MNFKTVFILAVLGAALGMMGCKASEKEVGQGNIDPGPKETFWLGSELQGDLNNQTFLNNKFFLWPSPLSSEVSSAVQTAGNEIDRNEDQGVAIRARKREVEKQIEEAKAALGAAVAALDEATKEKIEAIGAKLEEKAGLTPEDAEYAAQLQAEIDALAAELPTLSPDVAAAKAARDALYSKLGEQFTELYTVGKRGEELVAKVIKSTEYFENMPERVVFNFTPSGVQVTLVGWPEKGVTHSTDDGSIKVLSYDADRFGRLVFLVNTRPGSEFYRVRLVRSRLDVSKRENFARIFYQGELERHDVDVSRYYEGRTPERYGVAKLATSN